MAEGTSSASGERGDRLRVLVVTRIFPTPVEPEYAPYNRNQLAAVARRADVEILAAIPWFPGARLLHAASAMARAGALPFPEEGLLAGPLARVRGALVRAGRSKAVELAPVPATWSTAGLDVTHPRVLLLPKMTALHGPLFAASLARHAAAMRGKVDVVLGSFAYPDGVAAFLLAQALGVPAVMKLHGGDMNVAAKQAAPARWLRFVMPRLARVVAVSRPLADEAIGFGVAPDRAVVVENGVEKSLFFPRDRRSARAELGLPTEGTSLLFVGRIERRKGVFELMEALGDPRLAQVRLVWLGEGEESEAIRALAAPFGDRFTFVGPQPHDGVARHVAACDALVLPSWNEGTPNAVVEALSAGRRVVATRVGGIPAVVDDPRLGELVPVQDPRALADAIARVLDSPYDPAIVAKVGGRHDWDESGARLFEVLRAAAFERAGARAELAS